MSLEINIPVICFICAMGLLVYYTQFYSPHRAAIDESIAYLSQQRPIRRREYIPDERLYNLFCERYTDPKVLSDMARDILNHVGLPNVRIPVYPASEMDGKAAGLYKHSSFGSCIEIKIEGRMMPNNVLSVLIHECMHYYLRTTGLGFQDTLKNEILTDTAAIYFGFYEFIYSGYVNVGYIRYSEIKYINRVLNNA